MVLSNEHFYNIEVENGKVTETGNGNMVVGVAMPGLKDSLDLTFNDKELDIDIPDYVEVTADVVDFEIDMMMSMATANIVSDMDLDDFNLDDLNDSMTELKDATGELIDGTKELQDGTQELQDNMPDLDSGLTDLNNGAGDLLDGVIQIHEGAGTLGNGIYTLADSVEKKLVPGIDALTTGSKQVSDGVNQLASTISGMGTSIQSAKDGVIAQANAGLAANETLTAAAGTTVTMDNIDAVINAFKEKRTEAEGYLSYTDQQACVAAIMQAMQCEQEQAVIIYATQLTDEQKAGYASQFRATAQQGVDSLDSAIETLSGVKSQVEGATAALDGVMAQLSSTDSTESLKKLTEGAAQVSDGMAQLKTSVGTFDQTEIDAVLESGNDTICSGLYKLKDGASRLGEGTQELWDGSKDLKDGTQELRDSGTDLIDGVKKLNDGAIELKDGVKEYNEDGIEKLTRLVDEDANDIIDTLKQVIQLGKDYKSFAGKNESWDGSTVFIYKMDGINND
jgi:putative membrane protein